MERHRPEPSQKQSKGPWLCCETVQNAHILSCMLHFFTVPRLALNPNLVFEIGSRRTATPFTGLAGALYMDRAVQKIRAVVVPVRKYTVT